VIIATTGRKPAFLRGCTLALCVAALPALSGCVILGLGAVAAVGAGAVVYVKGNLEQTVSAPVKQVHAATVLALKDLGVPVLEDRSDAMTAKMESEFADGMHVWLGFEALNDQSTKITLRAGVMGEEQRARDLLEKIQKHL